MAGSLSASSLNGYFDNIAIMIPAQMYVTEQTDREEEELSSKYKKGLNAESKMAKKAKNKQMKAEKFASPENSTSLKVKQRKWDEMKAEEEGDGDGDSSDDDDDDMVASHVSDEDDETTTNDTADSVSTASESVEVVPGESRIEALRRKLSAKIEAKKNRPANGSNPSGVSKRAARKAAKKERQEAAKKKAKGGFSNAERSKSTSATKSTSSSSSSSDQVDATSPAPSTSNLADDLSGIDFGGISGLKKKKYFQDNKSLANQGKKKSLESMLSDAEEKKRRLKELKSSSNPEDKEKAKRILWGDTLKAADGEIIRDDPEKIKKAMKKKEKKKAKSAKQWEDRITTVADSMLEKQRIRKHNLDKRKLGGAEGANLSSKRIADDDKDEEEGGSKKGKKQRLGPHSGNGRDGFEGRKGDFITSGGGSSSSSSKERGGKPNTKQ